MIVDQIAEGDKVATHWAMTGKHTGEFFGMPPSGKDVRLTAIAIDRLDHGKIVEHCSKETLPSSWRNSPNESRRC